MWVKVKGQMGQGWPKAYDIGRWAHINVKLHFFFLGEFYFFYIFEKSVSYQKKDGRCFGIIFRIPVLLTLQCLCNPILGCISRGINLYSWCPSYRFIFSHVHVLDRYTVCMY